MSVQQVSALLSGWCCMFESFPHSRTTVASQQLLSQWMQGLLLELQEACSSVFHAYKTTLMHSRP
jgi:hypothetical protein